MQAISKSVVYAVVYESNDGITFIKLFKAEHNAKTVCRAMNKDAGYNWYEVKPMDVE